MAEWITAREAAAILGVHLSAIPKMIRRGDLIKREQRPVLNRLEVIAYRDARQQQAQEAARLRASRGPNPPDDDHDWLSSAEAGALMGISRTGVNVRARRGRLPSVLANGRRWYRRDHLDSSSEPTRRNDAEAPERLTPGRAADISLPVP